MQTVKPGPYQLFCKPDEAATVTKSGILIQEKSAERPKTAIVINTGDSVRRYHQNDRIIYKPYSINEIKLDDVEYFLVSEDDLLGTVVEVEE